MCIYCLGVEYAKANRVVRSSEKYTEENDEGEDKCGELIMKKL